MKKMLKPVYNCIVRDEEGAAMAEYGLLVALIAVVCIAGVTLLGGNLNARFNQVAGQVGVATP